MSTTKLALVSRGGIAAVVGLVIAFIPLHSARFGFIVFAGFAITTGLVRLVFAWRADSIGASRYFEFAAGTLSVIAGIAAASWVEWSIASWQQLVALWAVVTGATELYSGLREPKRSPARRERFVLGGLTMIYGVIVLSVNPQEILQIGLFGAYAVVAGMLLVVDGLTPVRATTVTKESAGA